LMRFASLTTSYGADHSRSRTGCAPTAALGSRGDFVGAHPVGDLGLRAKSAPIRLRHLPALRRGREIDRACHSWSRTGCAPTTAWGSRGFVGAHPVGDLEIRANSAPIRPVGYPGSGPGQALPP